MTLIMFYVSPFTPILLPMSAKTDWPIEIIRSEKRTKTVNAELKNGVLIIRAPAKMDDVALQPIIAKLQARLEKKVNPPPAADADLEQRAQEMNKRYFNGRLQWQSIRYVTNQNKRYGSCTPPAVRFASITAWPPCPTGCAITSSCTS